MAIPFILSIFFFYTNKSSQLLKIISLSFVLSDKAKDSAG